MQDCKQINYHFALLFPGPLEILAAINKYQRLESPGSTELGCIRINQEMHPDAADIAEADANEQIK